METQPLESAALMLDEMIAKWISDHKSHLESDGKNGKKMTEAEMRTALRRLKDCGITSAPKVPEGFGQDLDDEMSDAPLKHDTTLPQLSRDPDHATDGKDIV